MFILEYDARTYTRRYRSYTHGRSDIVLKYHLKRTRIVWNQHKAGIWITYTYILRTQTCAGICHGVCQKIKV